MLVLAEREQLPVLPAKAEEPEVWDMLLRHYQLPLRVYAFELVRDKQTSLELAHGEYPETLDALVPQLIEKLPHDIIGGQPLHYHCSASGKFLLYSAGWNETDYGGQVVLKDDGTVDRG
jgi:hypothetical protein